MGDGTEIRTEGVVIARRYRIDLGMLER